MHGSDERPAGDRPVGIIDENVRPIPRLRPYHVLAVLPTIGLLGGVPFANRVEPYVLGLPFLLFWVVMWVVATSVIMALITSLDARHPDDLDDERASAAIGSPTVTAASTVDRTTR